MQKKINMYFAPHKTCNLSCRYCYVPKYNRASRKTDDKYILHSLLSLRHKIEAESYIIGEFCFHGAEPSLMSPEALAEGVCIVKDHWDANGFSGKSASIQSNGTRFGEKYLSRLKNNLPSVKSLRLGFSIDPPKEVHDIMRDYSYDRVMKNFGLAMEMGFTVSVLSVVSDETMKCLPGFFEWMEKYLEMNRKYGNPRKIKFKFAAGKSEVSEEQMSYFAKELVRRDMTGISQIFSPGYCIQSGNECMWLEFGADGSCYSCNKAFYEEGIFADWKKDSIESIINKRKFLYSDYPVHADCAGCEFEFFCSSGCPIDRLKTGRTAGKAHECIMIKTAAAEIEKKGIHISDIFNQNV